MGGEKVLEKVEVNQFIIIVYNMFICASYCNQVSIKATSNKFSIVIDRQ